MAENSSWYQNWAQAGFSVSAFDSPIVGLWHNAGKGGWASGMKYRRWKNGAGGGWRAEKDTQSEVLIVIQKNKRNESIILGRRNEEHTFSKCYQSFIFVCQGHFLLQFMPVGLRWGHDPLVLPLSRSFSSLLSQKLFLMVSLSQFFFLFPSFPPCCQDITVWNKSGGSLE